MIFYDVVKLTNTIFGYFNVFPKIIGVPVSAAGYLQAAGYYTMPTTAAQLQQSAALYAAQPSVSQQSPTAAGAGADGRLQ